MVARLFTLLANAFIIAYSMDAAFSSMEEVYRHLTGSDSLILWRNLLASAVVVGSLVVVLAMVVSPRLLPPTVITSVSPSLSRSANAAPNPALPPARE